MNTPPTSQLPASGREPRAGGEGGIVSRARRPAEDPSSPIARDRGEQRGDAVGTLLADLAKIPDRVVEACAVISAAELARTLPQVLGALETIRASVWLALAMPRQCADLQHREETDALAPLPSNDRAISAMSQDPAIAGDATSPPAATAVRSPDVVDAAEAARLLGMSTTWLYRNARSLPFTRRLGPRTLRFSVAGLHKYLATRRSAY